MTGAAWVGMFMGAVAALPGLALAVALYRLRPPGRSAHPRNTTE